VARIHARSPVGPDPGLARRHGLKKGDVVEVVVKAVKVLLLK
jgi:hypothetical protein